MVQLQFISDFVLFIQNNTKLFKKNQHKRKYKVETLIGELFNLLKNNPSYAEYIGPVDKGSLFYTHSLLKKNQVFEKYYRFLIDRYFKHGLGDKLKYTIVDTTFIVNSYGVESIGRNKQYKWKKGNKVSLITDINGIPISIDFGTGNESDKSLLFKNINNMYIDTKSYLYKNNNRYKQYFLADKGYDTKKIRKTLTELGYITIIDYNKRNTKDLEKLKKMALTNQEKLIYKKRTKVENTNLFKKYNKRLSNRVEKTLDSFKSFVFMAFVKKIHKQLEIEGT